jgi:glucosyl-dolichyl phosphate glucuronosyltransferase
MNACSLSVVICTRNRSQDTIECLEALLPAKPNTVEVIVVDSGSHAEHARAMRQFIGSNAPVRYVRMDEPGTSIARNAGLDNAGAGWIWWLDDDAIPTADWPERVFKAIEHASEDTAAIGGKVVPKFETGSDLSHLTDRWRLLLSCIEGENPGYLSEGANVAGANLLMKRDVARQVGGFSEALGRTPKQLLSGEESLMIEQIEDHGFRCAYDPNFEVLHKVSSERLTREWINERAYWEGHVRYRVLKHLNRKLPPSLNPIKLWLSIPVLDLLARVRPDDPDFAIRANLARGTLDAQRGQPTR